MFICIFLFNNKIVFLLTNNMLNQYSLQFWMLENNTQQLKKKVEEFHNSCHRKIHKNFWPNINLLKISNCNSITTQIKQWQLTWVGHVLGKPKEGTPKLAFHWTLQGKWKARRPPNTCRRTIQTKIRDSKAQLHPRGRLST